MKLTVLTQKVNVIDGVGYFFKAIKEFLYRIKVDGLGHINTAIKQSKKRKEYTGHFGVTRSLCEGLKQLNINFNYNPVYSFSVNENVIVLSDIETLKIAIELKKKGKIKQLLAGPNLMVRPNEFDGILADQNIDKVIVPSEWVKIAYAEDLPSIKDKLTVWPCGVNASFFKPGDITKNPKKVLVYWKTGPENLLGEIESALKTANIEYSILKYGNYTPDDYKTSLASSSVGIFCSTGESQGLALQEAWSMDVPTFVWQPNELMIKGKQFSVFSSAPYLKEETGSLFKSIAELETLLVKFKNKEFKFAPRAVVIKQFTDDICAQTLLTFFDK